MTEPIKDWNDAHRNGVDILKTADAGWHAATQERPTTSARVGDKPSTPAKTQQNESAPRQTQAATMLELLEAAEIEPFETPDGVAYCALDVDDHRETHAVRSSGFRKVLRRFYYDATGSAPNDDAVKQVASIIEVRAQCDGVVQQVYLRVALVGSRVYIDLCDTKRRAIEVDADGWRIINDPPVRFRRTRGMLPLPLPERGGSIDELKEILPIGGGDDDDGRDFMLTVAWLLMAMRGEAGCPILNVTGEQGTGKSVTARMLRGLIDPNHAALRAPPRDVDQLIVMAVNSYIIVLDNLSSITAEVSDGLCRLVTSGGSTKRQLFTDGEEFIFDGHRPIVANGIGDVATRGDLADRVVTIRLNLIPEVKRLPERELLQKYETARPRILGALLDVVAHGLLNLPGTRLNGYPRMANFAQWVSACEDAAWGARLFMDAYEVNRGDAVEIVLDADPVAAAIEQYMSARIEYEATAAAMLEALSPLVSETVRRTRAWPANARAFSERLRRLAPALRQLKLAIEHRREGQKRHRLICIRREVTDAPT